MRCTAALIALFCLCRLAAAPDWVLLEDCTSEQGWGLNEGREFPGAKASITCGRAPDGTPALAVAVDMKAGGNYAGAERAVSIPAASRLRFRVWCEGVTNLMVRLRDIREQEHAGSAKTTPGSWQTVELPLDVTGFGGHWHGPNDGLFYFPVRRILIAANGLPAKQGRFWLRDIQILTDDASMLWGVEVRTESPGNVLFPTDLPARPEVHIRNRLAAAADVRAIWRVLDQDGTEVATGTETLSFAQWEAKVLRPALPQLDFGYYLLAVVLHSGQTVAGRGEGAFAIVQRLPNYGPAKDPDSFFGLHISDMAAAARIGVKWDRPHRAWWWGEARPKDYLWPDTSLDQAPQYGISTMMTLEYGPPNWAKKLAGDQPLWPPPPPLLAGWADYVTACVQRYADRVDCWEIQNEPDLTCYYHEKIPFETGVQSYVAIARTAHAAIRAAGSKLPVSGVDVSGGDYDGKLRFSRAVLAEVSGLFDVYTGHPYAWPRYFGEGKSPMFPERNHLVEKLEMSKTMLGELGGLKPVWVGEKGWGLDITEPLTGPHSLAYANCVAQALITGHSVSGVSRWFWFLQNGCNESGYEYGLWRGNPAQPLPAAVAYASCARFLHHVEPVRPLVLADGFLGFAFRGRDPERAVAALWATGDDAALASAWPEGTQSFSMYGRSLDPARITLSQAPVYLVAPLAQADALFARIEQADLHPRLPVRVETLHFARTDTVEARVHNLLAEPVSVELQAAGKTNQTSLPARSIATVALQLPGPLPETVPVAVVANGVQIVNQEVPARFAPCLRRTPTVDGDLAEWGQPQVVLKEHADVLPPDPGVGWDGPDDLSVEAWWGWNEQGLCFAARVRDDVHSVDDDKASTFWKSDSIQLALDVRNDAGDTPEFDPDDREFGFIAAGPTGKAFETVPKSKELAIPCVAKRLADTTVYEAMIPWPELGIQPQVGQVLALNFIVNDNDGHGRSYWIGLRPGIGEAKRPGVYLDVALSE